MRHWPTAVLSFAVVLASGPAHQAAKAWSVGLGAEADVFWSATDGIPLRFLQTFAGANTSNGSSYFLFYNHIFYFGSK